jgi:hypothetical protein
MPGIGGKDGNKNVRLYMTERDLIPVYGKDKDGNKTNDVIGYFANVKQDLARYSDKELKEMAAQPGATGRNSLYMAVKTGTDGKEHYTNGVYMPKSQVDKIRENSLVQTGKDKDGNAVQVYRFNADVTKMAQQAKEGVRVLGAYIPNTAQPITPAPAKTAAFSEDKEMKAVAKFTKLVNDNKAAAKAAAAPEVQAEAQAEAAAPAMGE